MRMIKVRLALLWLVIVPVAWTGTAAANPFEYNWQELAPGVWAGIRQDPFELPQEGKGMSITDQLDRENNRTAYVVPSTTFADQLILHFGDREIDFLHLGDAHTAGDVIMWLPREKIVATGDIVTAPVPLMPSAYVDEYPAVLQRIRELGFKILVPGHGVVERDAAYVGLLAETFRAAEAQMKALIAKGLAKDEAIAALDLSAIEARFTHGDPFLRNRFHDYVSMALPEAAWTAATGGTVEERF